jgi:predicted aminopeptidase
VNHSSVAATIRVLVAVALVAGMSGGCYLLQSAGGHMELMAKRKPISAVLAQPSTPPALRAQLEAVNEIRNFASRELKLPDNGSYRTYADVGRPYVVWNVVAAPEFAVEPKKWCYPIVGCVAYRGYFVERRAQQFGAAQRAHGLDVAIGGAAAYSTLGHFDDPILNTMVDWNDIELAGIVFHELTHQLLYVANDAAFNEALATTVEEEGVRRWLEARGRSADLQRHLAEQARYVEVIEMLKATRETLRTVYAAEQSDENMRSAKRAAYAALRERYAARVAVWGGRGPFDRFMQQDLNNAHLASIATYYACVPGFERELKGVDGDLTRFYARVKALGRESREARDAEICGGPVD